MTDANPFIKRYLMTAGPTPLPPGVQSVMSEPIQYHRDPGFVALFASVLERLPYVFGTENPVLTFASTGSGAMESAVANLTRDGSKILTCAAGKFGERWIELAGAFGADAVKYEPGWGQRLDPAEIDRLLTENDEIDVVFATLSETSTGIVHDIEAIAQVTKQHDAILVVDAVSGLGAAELRQDKWGVDVVVSGSQKALMCPPGLGFASVSPKALEYAAKLPGTPRTYYFNWAKTAKGQAKTPPDSPFTTSVTLFAALDVALNMIHEEGIENVYARHALLAQAARAGAAALGLDLYGDPDERSNVVTAIELPDGVDGAKVPGELRKLGITANGGQNELKGKIIRLAHTGYFGPFDILTSLSGLEMALDKLGHDVEHGAGVGAAQKVFVAAGVPVA